MKARIAEVFDSVQGEGLYLGEKQLFVRFFGCNLSCRFCDTKSRHFTEYTPEELFKEIRVYGNDLHSISFTGGEPLLQNNFLKEVLKLTASDGHKNYLETNGTLAGELKEVIDFVDIIAMDMKLPTASGMGLLWGLHRRFLRVACEKEVFIKAVIDERTEEEDIREAIALIKETGRAITLVLQPNCYSAFGSVEAKAAYFRELCEKNDVAVCVITQMHKLWGIR